jgi:branched-chain amino acid transport system substrate-binding protein
VVALLGLLGAGCGGSDRPVRIGLLTDCRGALSGFEEATLAGAELPLLRRGGRLTTGKPAGGVSGVRVSGRDVELVRGCSEFAEHTVLIEEARRLVEVEHVDAVVGPLGEGESFVLREIASRYPDVAFILASSGPQEVTLRRPAPNLYRYETDEAQDVAGLGTYAYRVLGWRRAAVIGDDAGGGWSGSAAFVAEFCALGGRVVQQKYVPLFFFGGRPEDVPRGLRDADGVAVLTSAFTGSAAFLPLLARAVGTPAKRMAVGPYVITDPAALTPDVARALEGVIGVSSLPPANSTAAMRRHRRAFASAFQGLPREFAEGPLVIGFHDAMEGLLQGLEAAGADLSNGRARLRAELASVRFEVPAGPVRLDRNRQAVRRTYIQRIARTAAGKPALRLVRVVRGVEQTFGGLLSKAPPPGPGSQPCRRDTPPPWAR